MTDSAGLGAYLRKAFLWRWNVLGLSGALLAAVISPWPGGLIPLVLAGEATFLTALVSHPRFRSAADAEAHAHRTGTAGGPLPLTALTQLLEDLPANGRHRFQELRSRCLQMQQIASGARGDHASIGDTGDSLRRSSLERLLWLFLRLLVSQESLMRFLNTTSETALSDSLEQLKTQHQAALVAKDERLIASLGDSVTIAEVRLENRRKAHGNARFVTVELDRIESKIQTLTELMVNQQDPDLLTHQVDAAAASLQETESTIKELQQITGLADQIHDPPPILDADLTQVLKK